MLRCSMGDPVQLAVALTERPGGERWPWFKKVDLAFLNALATSCKSLVEQWTQPDVASRHRYPEMAPFRLLVTSYVRSVSRTRTNDNID